MGKRRDEYGDLRGKPNGQRPLGRPRYRWEGNIKVTFSRKSLRAWNGYM
jgi:hypothetical protein